jgi:hypothetical protein
MILSLSEIINNACEKPNKQETVDYLKANDSQPLRTVLNIMYNKNIEILLPDTPPPWKKNDYVGVEGMLYKEARRLKIFVKGGGYDHLDKTKREQLFIKLLEDIDNNDADMLVKMIAQKPLKGLSRQAVSEAFPELNIKEENTNG